jgi:hypothetical protein
MKRCMSIRKKVWEVISSMPEHTMRRGRGRRGVAVPVNREKMRWRDSNWLRLTYPGLSCLLLEINIQTSGMS